MRGGTYPLGSGLARPPARGEAHERRLSDLELLAADEQQVTTGPVNGRGDLSLQSSSSDIITVLAREGDSADASVAWSLDLDESAPIRGPRMAVPLDDAPAACGDEWSSHSAPRRGHSPSRPCRGA